MSIFVLVTSFLICTCCSKVQRKSSYTVIIKIKPNYTLAYVSSSSIWSFRYLGIYIYIFFFFFLGGGGGGLGGRYAYIDGGFTAGVVVVFH